MGRMNLLNNIVNPANNQVEGFCVVKSVAIKSNVKGSDYLDMILADAGGEISASKPHSNLDFRRSSMMLISFGGRSEVMTICFPY